MCILILLFGILAVEAGKQRSWLGPSTFIEGSNPIPMDSFGFASLGGKLYVFGGWDSNNGMNDKSFDFNPNHSFKFWCTALSAVLDKLYEVDPEALIWTELKSGAVLGIFPGPRYGLGATSESGLIFVFGGFSSWITDEAGNGAWCQCAPTSAFTLSISRAFTPYSFGRSDILRGAQ